MHHQVLTILILILVLTPFVVALAALAAQF